MILCITHSNDLYTIDRVMAYFLQKNIKAIRINTDEFLTDLSIVSTLDDNGSEVTISSKAFRFKLSEVSGVWFRKIWQPRILDEIDPDYRDNVGREINTTLSSFFQLLEKQAPCINVLSKGRKVDGNKFDQLCQAKDVGLLTPETILTSDFENVKQFYSKHDGNIIAKLQNSLSFSMGAGERFFPTTQISEENLELLEDTLSCCPMIFQNNIPKSYELRIAYVNGECFTGKIDASKSDKGKQDWRYSEKNVAFWAHYELPIAEVEKIDKLMKRFELSFGAIDMIRQPNGEYVFLEVNPSGEWGMLEKELGYPIADSIAKSLLNRIENYEK
ncbi:MAG: glutathione synthase/RimK-type ligase-like ATP-grasp enzyme [Crocinitomix sp.]|jgi:glutathione synthase/RimK-type ligase-like ATP-grasp enzyme